MTTAKTKRCSKCGKEYPVSHFGNRRTTCKECFNAQRRYYRVREKMLKQAKEHKESSEQLSLGLNIIRKLVCGWSVDAICEKYRISRRHVETVALMNGKLHLIGKTCRKCYNYPCFYGIDNISSNLALTCHNYSPI